MTQQNDKPEEKRQIPPIMQEEDIPFSISVTMPHAKKAIDRQLHEVESIEQEITRFRYKTGKAVLYISMGAMGGCVLLDMLLSWFSVNESSLLHNAFEAFKLITMTVLGYMFGANNSK